MPGLSDIVRNGERIEIADGLVRVEAGPGKKRRRATAENLANDVTASHYQLGQRDAIGEVITENAMFTYLDWLGPKVFYVYKRREIEADDPQFAPNPDADLPPLPEDSTNVTAYTYVYDEIGVYATEDEAVDEGLTAAAQEG